jgi:BioD-like phosphotransacetylase family protein
MKKVLKVYVAATRQNDGKTTAALGLLEAMSEHFERVGYIKPVGQQVRLIGKHKIDKDASLMNDVFRIGSQLSDMSPVAVPKGFTERYILNGDTDNLSEKIKQAYKRASKQRDFMVIEGTGHAGVGSVFDLSNAAVARLLNTPVVIVSNAGIGRPIDEVMLNKAVFDSFDVPVLGVIINKVQSEKYEKINKFVRLGFAQKGIKTLGVIPFVPLLSSPTIRQLLEDVAGQLICGESGLDEIVSRMIVGAMPPHTALDYFKGDVLLITPGNREDLILAAIACNAPGISPELNVKGIFLTCGVWPNRSVLRLVEGANIPLILGKDDTFTTAQKITQLMIKIRSQDKEKIAMVKQIIKQYVDVEEIMRKLKNLSA